MRLDQFIKDNLDAILAEWVAFAREQQPAASTMDESALLDHGRLILQEIAADMARPQSADEQQNKAEGKAASSIDGRNLPSRSHARQREQQGFEIEQMVGEYRALRATVLRLWTASGGGEGQDFKDASRFNEAVDQAIAESLQVFVAEVNRSRDLFLGVLGHDLRGPLSTIASCTMLDLRAAPDHSPHAALILRSVAQMKALLDNLVEYTRHRLALGLAIEPAPLHLDRFTRDTLEEIDAIQLGHPLELVVEGDPEGEWDARRLHQALSNLVFNALKYGLPGSPIRVLLDGTRAGDVVLAVENKGPRIAPELVATLFDPLVRTDGRHTGSNSQVAGANLGLGLYVVREIARAHGGTVEVTSDDSATRFELRLPRFTLRRSTG